MDQMAAAAQAAAGPIWYRLEDSMAPLPTPVGPCCSAGVGRPELDSSLSSAWAGGFTTLYSNWFDLQEKTFTMISPFSIVGELVWLGPASTDFSGGLWSIFNVAFSWEEACIALCGQQAPAQEYDAGGESLLLHHWHLISTSSILFVGERFLKRCFSSKNHLNQGGFLGHFFFIFYSCCFQLRNIFQESDWFIRVSTPKISSLINQTK